MSPFGDFTSQKRNGVGYPLEIKVQFEVEIRKKPALIVGTDGTWTECRWTTLFRLLLRQHLPLLPPRLRRRREKAPELRRSSLNRSHLLGPHRDSEKLLGGDASGVAASSPAFPSPAARSTWHGPPQSAEKKRRSFWSEHNYGPADWGHSVCCQLKFASLWAKKMYFLAIFLIF